MKNNSHASDVIGSGCKALRALGLNNPYQQELMFVAEDVLSVIYETLKTFSEVAVLQECIGLLVCLATDLPIVLRQCMTMKIPDIILKIAENNFQSERLVEITLEAIGEKICFFLLLFFRLNFGFFFVTWWRDTTMDFAITIIYVQC